MKEIRSVAIVGMGALGLMYARHIANAKDGSVTFVMDDARFAKYQGRTCTINGQSVSFDMVPCCAAKPADLVILAVKYTGLDAALEVMAPCIGPDSVVISVMNGISSEERILARFPGARVVFTVAQGMDAMRFGSELRYTQMGALHIGVRPGEDPEAATALRAYFERIRMPYVWEEDILRRMWFKFMLNVGINQICMVYSTTYSGATDPEGEPFLMLIGAMREVMAVAKEVGVSLTEQDINTCLALEKTLDPDGTPSMGQDRINRKACEVDMFAGAVIELAEKYDICVPVNRFLLKRVREIEKEYV